VLIVQGEAPLATIDVKTEITGSIWKILATVGQKIEEDEPILILESMKMEIPVTATESGTLVSILAAEGDTITEGTVVARIEV
jgi:acetyl-CoA carboxylase biotin carboxyl carrier protein